METNNDEFNLVAEDSKEENELKPFEENGSKASEENDLKPRVIYCQQFGCDLVGFVPIFLQNSENLKFFFNWESKSLIGPSKNVDQSNSLFISFKLILRSWK